MQIYIYIYRALPGWLVAHMLNAPSTHVYIQSLAWLVGCMHACCRMDSCTWTCESRSLTIVPSFPHTHIHTYIYIEPCLVGWLPETLGTWECEAISLTTTIKPALHAVLGKGRDDNHLGDVDLCQIECQKSDLRQLVVAWPVGLGALNGACSVLLLLVVDISQVHGRRLLNVACPLFADVHLQKKSLVGCVHAIVCCSQ